MSQQPDSPSPSSYWQFEPGEIEASTSDHSAPPGQLYPAPTGVAQQEPRSGSTSAWQAPSAVVSPAGTSSVPPHPSVRSMPRVRRPSLWRILVPLAIVVLLGLAGSASGFGFSALTRHQGQATAPSPRATQGQTLAGSPTAQPGKSPTPHPTPTPSPTPTTVPSPTPVPQPVILAQDSFARPDQQFWGMASDGSTWGGDANSSQVFSIAGGSGQVSGGQGFFNAILGPRTASEEVFYSGSVSHFDATRDNLGAVLRWTDDDHYYKAYFDGASLILIKRAAGVVTRLGAVPFAAQDGVSYSLRFRAAGTQLLVRAWPSAGPEPGGWMITATDSTLASGFGGLRVLLEPGITVTVTRFQERSVG